MALHLLGGLLLAGAFVLGAGPFLTVADPPAPADAIVVLGGSVDRVGQGVWLYEEGYAPLVVLSGGKLSDLGLECSSALLSLERAQELGLPADATILAPEAQSTYDEAVNLGRLAAQHGWRSLLVVTDPLHTRRAARTFRTLLPGVSVSVSPAPEPLYDPQRWWRSEHGLADVFNEVLKLAFYWFRYGIRPF